MKAQFYYVWDLDLWINLDHVSSFQKTRPIDNDSIPYKCCIVVGKSIYFCDVAHFRNLIDTICES